jgi:hypothetical protein
VHSGAESPEGMVLVRIALDEGGVARGCNAALAADL